MTAGPDSLVPGSSGTRLATSAAPLIAGVGILMVGNGLLLTLFGVRATQAGFSALVVGAVLAATLVFVPSGGPLPMVGMLLLGGLSYSQYSIVLAEVNDHLEHHHMASAGAHLVALNGLGAAAAPLLVAVAFLAVGNQGYYWVLSGVHAVTGLAVVAVAWAARRSRRSPQHRAAWTGVVS